MLAFPIVLHQFKIPKTKEVKFSSLLTIVKNEFKNEARLFLNDLSEKRKFILALTKSKPRRYSECAEKIKEYLEMIKSLKHEKARIHIEQNIQFHWRSGLQNSKRRRVNFRSILFEEIMMTWLYGICLINFTKDLLKRSAEISKSPDNNNLSPAPPEEFNLHIIRTLRLASGVFTALSLNLIPQFHRCEKISVDEISVEKTPSSPTGFPLKFKTSLSPTFFGNEEEDYIASKKSNSNNNNINEKENDISLDNNLLEKKTKNWKSIVEESFFELDVVSAYAIRCYCIASAQMIKLYSISSGIFRNSEKSLNSSNLRTPVLPKTPIRPTIKNVLYRKFNFNSLSEFSPGQIKAETLSEEYSSNFWISSVSVSIFQSLDDCFSSVIALQRNKKYSEKKMEIDHQFILYVSQYRIIYRSVVLQQLAIHYYNLDKFGICCSLIKLSLKQIEEILIFKNIKRNQSFIKEMENFILGISSMERKYLHENDLFFHKEHLKSIPKGMIPNGKNLIAIKHHIIDSSTYRNSFSEFLK